MIRKSRMIVALGLVLALGLSALAFADGASENEVGVYGKVKPNKLDSRKYKPVKFFSGVTTDTTHAVPGQQNAERVLLEWGKNIKFDSKAAPVCTASINGTTTEQAKSLCPPGSNLGSGVAHANLGGGPDQVSDVTVTAFNGPGNKHVRLHAYTPSLGAANTQVVDGDIIKAPSGGKYGYALNVTDAPDLGGDAFMLTQFDATIDKSTKTVLARCKAKKFLWKNTTTYDDGTKETSQVVSQPCKRK